MANEQNLIPAQKGEVRNPLGRPKGSRNRNTEIKELFEFITKEKNALTGNIELLTQEKLISIAIVVKAKNGDVNAYNSLMNSCYGAPLQQIENTNIEQPIFPDVTTDDGG